MPSSHEKCCKTLKSCRIEMVMRLLFQSDSKIVISSLAIVAASISSKILLQNLGYDHFIGYKKDTIRIFRDKVAISSHQYFSQIEDPTQILLIDVSAIFLAVQTGSVIKRSVQNIQNKIQYKINIQTQLSKSSDKQPIVVFFFR